MTNDDCTGTSSNCGLSFWLLNNIMLCSNSQSIESNPNDGTWQAQHIVQMTRQKFAHIRPISMVHIY